MKFADLPENTPPLRSVNGCKSKWQVERRKPGQRLGEGSTMMGALKDFHFHGKIKLDPMAWQTSIDNIESKKMGLK